MAMDLMNKYFMYQTIFKKFLKFPSTTNLDKIRGKETFAHD